MFARYLPSYAPRPVRATQVRPYYEGRQILKEAILRAKDVCNDQNVDEFECAVAWDTVDEISRGVAHREETDAMEVYCLENPDADECRTYDV